MSKIGIITFFRDNYGAFLQSYALERTLQSIGHEAEIINYDYTHEKCILGIPFAYLKTNPLFFLKRVSVEILRYNAHKKKKQMYDRYVKNHLVLSSKKYQSFRDINNANLTYDILISGSDQVFNPQLHINSYKTRLLSYDCNVAVKATYAASLGGARISGEYEKELLEALKSFSYISIRESEAACNIEEKLGRKVYSHCDPTLLLSRDDWNDFSEQAAENGKYALLYLLKFDETIIARVSELVKEGVNVISIGNRCRVEGVTNISDAPVDQFVSYIRNADRVITNSFHGTIFSIIFHKSNVDVFLPPQGGERITNIIKNCSLSSYFEFGVTTSEDEYTMADFYILQEKENALNYLREVTGSISSGGNNSYE